MNVGLRLRVIVVIIVRGRRRLRRVRSGEVRHIIWSKDIHGGGRHLSSGAIAIIVGAVARRRRRIPSSHIASARSAIGGAGARKKGSRDRRIVSLSAPEREAWMGGSEATAQGCACSKDGQLHA